MKKQSGFTLIEFMVAMGITLVILAAAVAVFRDAVQTNQNVTFRSDLNDNLRAGMNLLEQDLIQTGTGIPTGGISIPNTPNSAGTCNSSTPVNRPTWSGTLTFPTCNFVLPAIEPGSALGPLITGPDAIAGNITNPNSFTDIITILYADNSLALDVAPINRSASGTIPACAGTISSTGNAVTFDSTCINFTTAGITIKPGDLIMFSNTLGNAIQTVTSVSGQTLNFAAGDAFNLNGRTTSVTNGTMANIQSGGVYPPTTATRIWMVTYYLDNVTDPTHTRLIRRLNFNTPQAVGETIENLQFTYNFVDGVTNPSSQAAIPTGLSENQIRSINVYMGARSNSAWGKTKAYLRSNFQTQVSLRSMAYVNRYK